MVPLSRFSIYIAYSTQIQSGVGRDYESLLGGLSWELRGKIIGNRTESLSEDHTVVREHVRPKWEQFLTTLGMEMSQQPRPSSSESVGQRLLNSSASKISAITKAELIIFLPVSGRSVDVWVNKPEVVAAVMQLKADIQKWHNVYGRWHRARYHIWR